MLLQTYSEQVLLLFQQEIIKIEDPEIEVNLSIRELHELFEQDHELTIKLDQGDWIVLSLSAAFQITSEAIEFSHDTEPEQAAFECLSCTYVCTYCREGLEQTFEPSPELIQIFDNVIKYTS